MRVLIAGQTYFPAFNGQAIFTTNLADGLVQRGHEVMVILPSDRGRGYRNQRKGVQIENVGALSLGLWHSDSFVTFLPGISVRRVLDRFQPHIVHIHDHYPLSRSVLQSAQFRQVKCVGTNHFMPENLAPYIPLLNKFKFGFNWLLWQWMLDLFNRLDVVTAPSQTAVTILRRQGLQAPVYPVSCGVDLEKFRLVPNLDQRALRERYGLDPEKTTFLFVGRVDGEKRLDVLLQALRRLERGDVQVAVAGRGAAVADLKSLASRLGVLEQVRFLGFVPDADLPALLNSVDIFTMPSEAELLSIATLEAMACGRPVLAARARALPELVTDGDNGYLFEAGNPASAAHAMGRLVDSPERWPSMSAASLRKVQVHSLENTIRRYEELYEIVLTRAPVPSLPNPSMLSPRMTKRIQQLVIQLWQ